MILGHEPQKDFLNSWLENALKGSLILYGPEGIGKLSLVKEILSAKKEWEKIIIETEDKILRIETARFIERLTGKKTSSKRIIVVNDFHKLREESQNVILKTIEEPKSNTLFLLISHKINKIIPTIKSRSLLISFKFLPPDVTFQILRERNFSSSDIDFALKFYPYQPGKAIRLLSEVHFFSYLKKFLTSSNLDKIYLLQLKNFLPKEKQKEIGFYFRWLIELLILWERNEILEKSKHQRLVNFRVFDKIKELLEIYNELDYDFNFELQLTNIFINYG